MSTHAAADAAADAVETAVSNDARMTLETVFRCLEMRFATALRLSILNLFRDVV